ncbi:MAG: leucine-rich repeat domain-containing protein [Salinivirgaceae bacterium]|nr:leucine-rich repeat domain-containing protein [Salinivirgaceae bacterium]
MKRLFTILFATMLAGQASAQTTFEIGNLEYTVIDEENHCVSVGTASINNTIGNIVIPETAENKGVIYRVSRINSYAFAGCKKLTSISIPNSVESIGYAAFNKCNSLISVTLPDSIIMDESAFVQCDNLQYNEYDNACYLGNNKNPYILLIKAKSNDVGSCIINDKCRCIIYGAFSNCNNLTSVTIPESVVSIGKFAFQDCNNLTSIFIMCEVSSTNAYLYFTKNGIRYRVLNKNTVEVVSGLTMGSYSGSVIIPEKVTAGNIFDVTNISGSAFSDCSELTSITIPNSVANIGDYAFNNCINLTTVSIPETIINIEENAFNNCDNLDYNSYNNAYYIGNEENPYVVLFAAKNKNIESCEINSKCKMIFPKAFYRCIKILEIEIPNSVTKISTAAFCGCSNLTSVLIPNSVKYVGSDAFTSCGKLASIEIPNSVTYIGEYAFRDCYKLESVNIPDSIASINFHMFWGCRSLKSVTVPNSVIDIGFGAFEDCQNLTSITIPNSVTNISSNAFSGCRALNSAIIGNAVLSIGNSVFNNCNSLEYVISLNITPPTLTDDPFSTIDVIYVPTEAVEAYKSATFWKRKEILPLYGVKAISVDTTMGIVQGDSLLFADKILTFSATPTNDYHFVKWSDGNTDNPRSYSVASDTSFTAIFEAHTAVTDAAVAATCTATGLTEGSHCSVCGEVFVAQQVTPMLEHTTVVDAAVPATCTETGLTEGLHCSVCNEILVAQETVAAKGHTEVVDTGFAPTCAEFGITNGKHCSVCNIVLVAQDTIPALGHTVVVDSAVAATATEIGLTEGSHCSVCGLVIVAQDTIPALGESGEQTAVAESAANAVNIYVTGNTIVVENAIDEIRVYNAMGKLVGRDVARNVCTIRINNSGLYIVKTGNTVKRVMVN